MRPEGPGRRGLGLVKAIGLLAGMAVLGIWAWQLAASQDAVLQGPEASDDALSALSCPSGLGPGQPGGPTLGLFGTLPIYWNEAGQLADYLAPDHKPHWVRMALEACHAIRPLNTLDSAHERAGEGNGPQDGKGGLAELDYLLMAQPRALSPAENLALDDWVRAGGRLLLFADPMLTGHSIHPLGDPRRPADVVILSPILGRWGLRMEFDELQAAGGRVVPAAGVRLPVDLAGRLIPLAADGAPQACTLTGEGVMASCRIGQGRVLIVADAALLNDDGAGGGHGHEPGPDQAMRLAALQALLQLAFAP